MSVKKNLTIATLAALLAVPAFGVTNFSKTVHMPSVTAHADTDYHDTQTDTVTTGTYVNGQYEPVGTPVYGGHDQDYGTGYISGTLGSPNGNFGKILGADLDNGHAGDNYDNDTTLDASYTNSNGTTENLSATDSTNSDSSSNSQTSSSELPQTGESSDKGIMALGATALMASASLAALSMSKKRKEMALEETNTEDAKVSADDGKGEAPHYSTKSNYDMIMSKTFSSIGNGLKNL